MAIEAKVVSVSELTDRKENPAFCLSALRVFEKCHKCQKFVSAMRRYRDFNTVVQKLDCKPQVSEAIRALLSKKRELSAELKRVNKELGG